MTGSAAAVAAALRTRQTFVITSHARPDGDAIGSSMALALALRALGKSASVVLHDPVPVYYRDFPAVDEIRIVTHLDAPADAVVVMECSELSRPEISGLDRYTVVNIDHHLGNTMYGAVNWFDDSAAACGELVAELIDELEVRWSAAIASHLYLAIATDTGGFRYGPISARTFDLCRRIVETGVETATLSRRIFDSFSLGRVRLTGALLNHMELYAEDTFAVLYLDDALLRACGATLDDTEGLVNIPLGAREVMATMLIKRQGEADTFRVSLRSKGAVDVRAVAAAHGGGGHLNAAGCTVVGPLPHVKRALVDVMERVLLGGRRAPYAAVRHEP